MVCILVLRLLLRSWVTRGCIGGRVDTEVCERSARTLVPGLRSLSPDDEAANNLLVLLPMDSS